MNKGIIIYVPGLLATGYLHSLSLKARMFFLRRGYEFRVVHAKPSSSISERTYLIVNMLSELDLSTQRVHLVGHSMGGLSCRKAAWFLNNGRYVDTVTTISTPHRGSIFADAHVKFPTVTPADSEFEKVYKQLTSGNMSEFNRQCLDNSKVRYFSMGFFGDKMVTPSSAEWGDSLGNGHCSHLKQMSPYFGGQFSKTFQIVIDNLESLNRD